MASVTFDASLGGDGSTVSDDANPSTGLKAGGHRTRFVAALVQFVAMVGFARTKAQEAQAAAATAVNAPGTNGTSITNVALPAVDGLMTVTTQTAKAWAVGQWVVVTATADLTKWAMGQIESYNSGTGALGVRARQVNGAGTFASWSIGLTTPLDASLTGRVTALETEAARQVARRRLLEKETL